MYELDLLREDDKSPSKLKILDNSSSGVVALNPGVEAPLRGEVGGRGDELELFLLSRGNEPLVLILFENN